VANGAAWPAAYLLMSDWLRSFAYRVDIRPGIFVLSAGAAFAVALLTILYQTLRAATADPVDSLRYE
jgi:putative ABC transport system permease protein